MVDTPTKERRRTNQLLTLLSAIAVCLVLRVLSSVLIPLAVALFLSFLAMPVVRLGKRCHIPVAASLVLVILVFASVLGGVGNVLYTSGAEFVDQLPSLEQGIIDDARTLLQERFPTASEEVAALVKDIGSIASTVGDVALGGVDVILSGLSFTMLVLLFMVFIVLDRGHGVLDRKLIDAFSQEGTESARPILQEINQRIETYIIAKTGISLLTGTLTSGTLVLFGMPYVLLFGLITFFLNYVPNIGSIVAVIPPVVVSFVALDSMGASLLLLLVLGVIQFGIGNLLEPVVLGKTMQLSPLTVLLALVLWGWVWGIWGMVLAVPLTAVIRIVLDHTPHGRPLARLL